MLSRYTKILCGRAKPRFLAAQRSGFLQKQLAKLAKSKTCTLCDNKHNVPNAKIKISKGGDSTFRNATVLAFGSRGKAKTPIQAAAQITKAYGRGKKTLIITGDVAHGVPFLLTMLEKLTVPVAVLLSADPLYSGIAGKMFNRIIDMHVLTLRWADPGCAAHFGEDGYVETAQRNVRLAKGETVVRIPTVPGHLECDAKSTLEWLAKHAPEVRVQLVQSHKPRALERAPELNRVVTITELNDVVAFAHKLGLDAESVTV